MPNLLTMKPIPSLKKQQGSATGWFFIFLVTMSIAVVSSEAEFLANKRRNDRQQQQEAYLEQTAAAVTAWYQRNIGTIDATGTADPTVADVLAGAGITSRYGLHVSVSQRLSSGSMNWHSIALWINDSPTDSTTFISSTGAFNPDPKAQAVLVSGQRLQQEAWQRTASAVNTVVSALNNYAQQRQAAYGGDMMRNPFRPVDCNNIAPGEMPCLDTYTSTNSISPQLGLNSSQLVDAWNGAIQVSNGTDARTTGVPYTMVVKATTPWGAAVTGTAIQTVN